MLKRAGLIILIVVLFVAMFTFTALNTGEVELDLGFFEGTYPISVAFAGTFVFGILFGMLCMTAFVIRLINERRNLRRALRISESEISSLRNLPLADAD
jgi:putative membrane protein